MSKAKYKIGDKLYKLYSDDIEFMIELIASGSNPIEEFTVNSHEVRQESVTSTTNTKTNSRTIPPVATYFSNDLSTSYEVDLTTDKQSLINKVKDIIIDMESNIQKVKTELGIKNKSPTA